MAAHLLSRGQGCKSRGGGGGKGGKGQGEWGTVVGSLLRTEGQGGRGEGKGGQGGRGEGKGEGKECTHSGWSRSSQSTSFLLLKKSKRLPYSLL